MSKKIVIVGGVAGGATAAARLRRLSETDEIIMYERGEYISFANCGLPYYIGEVITDRKKLLVQTVEGMEKRYGVTIRNLTEVITINREEKTILARNVKTGEQHIQHYDVLILSPGAAPLTPPIPGLKEATNVFTLRNIPDTDRIKAYVDQQKPKHATVIGGGFIGVEMVENLVERGVTVSLVEMNDQVLAPLDIEMASIVHHELRAKGVELILSDGVSTFEDAGHKITLTSGRTIATDLVILGIGVRPESDLARDAGLTLGMRNTIAVNEHLQTSDPSIYAIGDAISVKDWVQGVETYVPLAWPANRQGRMLADIINGKEVSYKGTLGTSVAKVFDLTAATTGNNEKTLKRLGVAYQVVHVHPANHATYYPGASQITLKLVFSKETGQIFGAQAVGRDGVDKR
ncbi:MAG: FAD-dependent oxidoreductase, partial [Bacilli bacterium]